MKVSALRLAGISLMLCAGLVRADFEEDYENRKWQEVAVQLPEAPRPANLIAFYVSAATENRFYIDSLSLSVGSDGVVRYTLVIETPGGARNVTYEGMRCETRERRIYASGHADGGWAKSRRNDWVRIQDVYANRHHAALYLEYFCPVGTIIRDAAEARLALRRGGHPDKP